MDTELGGITINGVEYVKKSEVERKREVAQKIKGMSYVIVRTYSAGVFAGYLKSRDGKEVEMIKARRLWYWDGSASLSQLAVDGVCKPENCKFPCELESIILTEAIEIITCTEKARLSIAGVKIWEQK